MTSEHGDKRQKRLATFRTLVQERVVQLNVSWVQLEQGVGDREVAEGLRRELHTLKGEAGLLGFSAVSEVAHGLEDVVGAIVENRKAPTSEIGDMILEGFDLIVTLSEREPEALAPEAGDFVEGLQEAILEYFERADEDMGDDDDDDDDESDLILSLPESPPPIRKSSGSGEDTDQASLVRVPSDTPKKRTSYSVRVDPKQLDQIRDIIGELLLTRTRLASSAAALHRQRHGQGYYDPLVEQLLPGPASTMERDDLLRSIESQLRDDVLRMSNLVNALDEVTRDLRMVSISVIFERYPLAVRSLGKLLGRQVQLVCEGEAVEADRDVLEALDDPLLHLVRNALSHGIEPPEERRRKGKSPTGVLTLQASVAGDILRVEVKDDGAGIDVNEVKRKAIERGLMDPGTARTMTDRQVLRCLFEHGMTTRDTVDPVSGQGIGLDVVQRTVRNLGGTVEVVTELGKGTTFQMSVPIRASITSVLLFGVGKGRYALPTSSLIALEELEDHPLTASIDGPALQYKDGLVPLIALEPVLGEPAASSDTGEHSSRVIIVRHGPMLIGLTGSHSHLQREAVLKPLGSMLRDDKLITAGVALEDGSVALVINPSEVFKAARGIMEEEDLAPTAPPPTAPVRAADQPTVLVAEDSPIVRDLVVEALRIHGVNVVEAIDGQDALDKLAQYTNIDLLVTDVEMPRLDGLGLIKQMRAQGGRRIPAVVVSTRGSDADKLAAVQVGADAYLVKSDFTREGLWALVSRFLG